MRQTTLVAALLVVLGTAVFAQTDIDEVRHKLEHAGPVVRQLDGTTRAPV